MTSKELERSALSGEAMPAGLSPAHQALWLARAGKWNAAHQACQNIPGHTGCWIHAHLHRHEGDHSNAAYWYSRAEKPVPSSQITIIAEWHDLASKL